MRRWILTLMLALALTAGLAAVSAAHRKAISSTVTLSRSASDYGDSMSGAVGAARRACRTGRTVTLYRTSGDSKEVYEQTETSGDGSFKLAPKGQVFQSGSYYARTPRKVLRHNRRHRHFCRAAVSTTLDVVPPPGRD